MNRISIFVLIIMLSQNVWAQIGGQTNFDFLSSPGSARLSALGGALISVQDGDISLVQQNPAVGNESMDNQLAINHIFHFSGINEGMVVAGKNLDSLGFHVHGGIQYASYGNFTEADNIGNIIGEFKANEVGLILGASRQLNSRIRAGVNTKFVLANYAGFNGFGLGFDVGTIYHTPGKNWSIGLVAQNIGFSSTQFDDMNNGLPFDLKLGYSNKLKYLPFRYSVTYHHLQRWFITFDDPNALEETNFFDEPLEENNFAKGLDNFFRHLVVSGEFLLGKTENLNLRFGYNHLRKKELKVSTFRSLGGFSLGFGIKIKRFKLDYGLGYYHIAGATNHVGVRLLLGDGWKTKKPISE